MDNFIWNAALSWFRFVEEHNDINQITFNQVNLPPGPVNGTGWNTLARRKDTAINFLSGLSHEGPLKHQTSWRRIHRKTSRLETFHAPYFGPAMMGPEDLENIGTYGFHLSRIDE